MTRKNCRLDGQITLLTGGAGEIGQVTARKYLEEGATVIITGRTEEKLKNACTALVALDPSFATRLHYRVMDSGNIESLNQGCAWIKEKFGHLDVLINNAGTAGSLRPLADIPTNETELAAMGGNGRRETLQQSVFSLLGSPWLTTLACLPLLARGARIVNISTIFSRTEYYGRIPYVVPKAALNALSKEFALGLGKSERGIRVNTVYPGPVETDRIRFVFGEMDKMKGLAAGTTQKEILESMTVHESGSTGKLLNKDEIADSIVFLGSTESGGLAGHDVEVSHGLKTPRGTEVGLIERPNLGQVNYGDRIVWIIGGKSAESIAAFARQFIGLGAEVVITPSRFGRSSKEIPELLQLGLTVSPSGAGG